MTARIDEKNGIFIPQNPHLSYVLCITLPQPTIRIKIPKVLIKATQKRNQNQARSENDGNGGKMSFRRKFGSIFSNVFGAAAVGGDGNKKKKKKKKSPETGFKGENGEVHDDDMKKLKKMIESIDMGEEKIVTRKRSEDYHMVEFGNERKEKPRSARTFFSKTTSRIYYLESKKAKTNQNVGDSNGLGSKGTGSLKQVKNYCNLTRFGPSSHNRRPKFAWWMRKETESRELCKKRILMGGKCRPLNHSGVIQYDENGVFKPEMTP